MSREKVVRFGRETKLVGVLSEPQGGGPVREPMLLLVNSGILHRVGACRFHVRLARRLASEGVSALRFDFSGIGDSEGEGGLPGAARPGQHHQHAWRVPETAEHHRQCRYTSITRAS